MKPTKIEEVEQMAAQAGISFAPEDYEQAYRVGEQRRQQIEAEHAAQNQTRLAQTIDIFNRLFPRLLRALFGIGDVAIVFIQTLLIGPGLLAVLGMLLYVEVTRVERGIALFEVRPDVGVASAISLVVLNLLLELVIGYAEHRDKWSESPAHEFSLKIWRQRVGYIWGRSADWTPRSKSPADTFRKVLRLVAIAILALALSGAMRTLIENASGNWWDGLQNILLKSSLLDMTTWLVSLLFALAAVISAQRLTNYVSRRAIEIGAALAIGNTDAAMEAAGMSAAIHLLAKLKEKQRERRSIAPASALPRENVVPVPDVSAHRTDTGETPKLPPAIQKAIDWFEEHDTQGMSVREIAHDAQMSTTTIQRAIQERKKHQSGTGE